MAVMVLCCQSHFMRNMLNYAFWKFSSPFVLSTLQFSSVQSLSHVRFFVTPWIAARQASLPIANSQSSLRLMSIESMMSSSHLILCRPLLLLPPIPPSVRVFSNESTLPMRWPKYWSFSFSIIPSKEIPGLISFRMDWLDLLAVQGTGTLKSLLQLNIPRKKKWKSLSPTLCNPMDYRVHGILQARILEWVAFSFSRGSSQPKYRTQASHTAGRFFTSWATREISHRNSEMLELQVTFWLMSVSLTRL